MTQDIIVRKDEDFMDNGKKKKKIRRDIAVYERVFDSVFFLSRTAAHIIRIRSTYAI